MREVLWNESKLQERQIYNLLLLTAAFGHRLRTVLETLLSQKPVIWNKEVLSYQRSIQTYQESLTKTGESLRSLADLTIVEPRWRHREWDESRTRIVKLLEAVHEAIDDVELHANAKLLEALRKAQIALKNLLLIGAVTDDVLASVQVVTNFAYGWEKVVRFVSLMQDSIRANPSTVERLRAVFLHVSIHGQECRQLGHPMQANFLGLVALQRLRKSGPPD